MTIGPLDFSHHSSGIGAMIAQQQAYLDALEGAKKLNSTDTGGNNGTRGTNSQIHSGAAHGANLSPGAVNYVPNISAHANTFVNPLGPIGTRPRPFKPIENTGIRVGEIVGWRMWRVNGDYLESYSAGRIWAPEEHMAGEPSDFGSDGIWAFKQKSRAIGKMLETYNSAYGSVKLWGKVIEYEFGYRAECAKITSIDDATLGIAAQKVWKTGPSKENILRGLRENYRLAA